MRAISATKNVNPAMSRVLEVGIAHFSIARHRGLSQGSPTPRCGTRTVFWSPASAREGSGFRRRVARRDYTILPRPAIVGWASPAVLRSPTSVSQARPRRLEDRDPLLHYVPMLHLGSPT